MRTRSTRTSIEAFDEDGNEPAFLLHVMDADGSNIDQVSFNQSHDMDPAVLASGQVVFSRWDNAGNNDAINLYRMNPDGSQLELLYGKNSHDTGTDGQTIQFTQPRQLEDGRIMALIRPFTGTSDGGDIITIDTPTYLENTQPTRFNPGMSGPAQARATTVNDVHDGAGRGVGRWPLQLRVPDPGRQRPPAGQLEPVPPAGRSSIDGRRGG